MSKTKILSLVERVGSTFAFAALGVALVYITPVVSTGGGVNEVEWLDMLSAAAIAGIGSVLKCVVAMLMDGNPSLGSFEVLSKPGATADPVGSSTSVVVEPDAEPTLF